MHRRCTAASYFSPQLHGAAGETEQHGCTWVPYAGLAAAGAMPADPVVTLVMLLEGAMPTAQNLVVLLNLDEKVRVLAAGRASAAQPCHPGYGSSCAGPLASCLRLSFSSSPRACTFGPEVGHLAQHGSGLHWSALRSLKQLEEVERRAVLVPQTQAGAARLAELLLRLYAIAVVPLTLWVTVFVLQLPVPLGSL